MTNIYVTFFTLISCSLNLQEVAHANVPASSYIQCNERSTIFLWWRQYPARRKHAVPFCYDDFDEARRDVTLLNLTAELLYTLRLSNCPRARRFRQSSPVLHAVGRGKEEEEKERRVT
jgi:hypothetical protein